MTADRASSLRPLSLGQLLDQTIRIYRKNFAKLIGIVAVVVIPVSLLRTLPSLSFVTDWLPRQGLYDWLPISGLVSVGLTLIVGVIGFILVQGTVAVAITRVVTDHYLGRPTSFGDAFRQIGRSWLRVSGALFLVLLIVLGLLMWLLVPCIGWFTGGGLLLFFLQVLAPLTVPVVVLERQSLWGSIRRAWNLARRRFWWVGGLVAVLFIFDQIVVSGPVYLVNVLLSPRLLIEIQDPVATTVAAVALQSLTSLLSQLLYLPIQLICMVVLYFDLRVRTEGLDLVFRTEDALDSGAQGVDIIAMAPPPDAEGLLTWTEVGYFALISIGLFMICGLIYGLLTSLMVLLLGPLTIPGL